MQTEKIYSIALDDMGFLWACCPIGSDRERILKAHMADMHDRVSVGWHEVHLSRDQTRRAQAVFTSGPHGILKDEHGAAWVHAYAAAFTPKKTLHDVAPEPKKDEKNIIEKLRDFIFGVR